MSASAIPTLTNTGDFPAIGSAFGNNFVAGSRTGYGTNGYPPITAKEPSMSSVWDASPAMYAGTLDSPMRNRPITNVPSWVTNPSYPVTRRVPFIPEMAGIRGAVAAHMIAILYKGYTSPNMSGDRLVHVNERIEQNLFGTPCKEPLLTLPIANYVLVDLARKGQTGELKRKYNQKYVESMFVVDGVLEQVINDEMIASPSYASRRETVATVLRSGRLLTRNIWGGGLPARTPVYVGLQKFDPTVLREKCSYSLDPGMETDGLGANILDEIIKDNTMNTEKQTWVYQFVPVLLHTATSAVAGMEQRTSYLTETNNFETMKPVLIGYLETGTPASVQPLDRRMLWPPAMVTCSAKHAPAPVVPIYVNVV